MDIKEIEQWRDESAKWLDDYFGGGIIKIRGDARYHVRIRTLCDLLLNDRTSSKPIDLRHGTAEAGMPGWKYEGGGGSILR